MSMSNRSQLIPWLPNKRPSATSIAIVLGLLWLTACATPTPPQEAHKGTPPNNTVPTATAAASPAMATAQPPSSPLPRTILPAASSQAPPAPTDSPRPPQPTIPQERIHRIATPTDHPGIARNSTPPGEPIHDILFDFDSAILGPDALATLRENLIWLNSQSTVPIIIEGHCDERGSLEYNLALGHRRATATADYLIKGGVSPGRVHTISYGKELPFALGHDEAAWGFNRRAHFRIHGPPLTAGPGRSTARRPHTAQ